MQTKEYRMIDKSAWGEGPWLAEPDKIQWQDPATGLPCLIVRNNFCTGSLCGYVGVPEGHPDHGKRYQDVDDGLSVHGGLTFAMGCQPGADEATGICHVPDPGEPDHVWWFGFDCAHAGDVMPALQAFYGKLDSSSTLSKAMLCPWNESGFDEYRDVDYVKAEVTQLAQQLALRAQLAHLCR